MIRSQDIKLTQLLAMTETHKFPLQALYMIPPDLMTSTDVHRRIPSDLTSSTDVHRRIPSDLTSSTDVHRGLMRSELNKSDSGFMNSSSADEENPARRGQCNSSSSHPDFRMGEAVINPKSSFV